MKETTSQMNEHRNLKIWDKVLDKQELQKYYFEPRIQELKPLNDENNAFRITKGKGPWRNVVQWVL